MQAKQRVLVVGAYGLIGTHVLVALRRAGHDIVAAGRRVDAAARAHPYAEWVTADLAKKRAPADWMTLEMAAQEEILYTYPAELGGIPVSFGEVSLDSVMTDWLLADMDSQTLAVLIEAVEDSAVIAPWLWT